jgi:hypothetical protein
MNPIKTNLRSAWLGLPAALLLSASLPALAGNFSTDFNSGLPAGSTIYGNAAIYPSGGYTNSGYLLLTTNAASQNGAFVITNNLDNGAPVVSFSARFKCYIGPGSGGADGISFSYVPDLLTNPAPILFGEEGAGTGLVFEFDTYSNPPPAIDNIGVDIKWEGSELATLIFTGLRQSAWVDVAIALQPDGTVGVLYDGTWLYTNMFIGFPPAGMANGYFALGARTGGLWDNQLIDNLSISTFTNGTAFVREYRPVGRGVRADAVLDILLNDFNDPVTGNSQVDPSKISLVLDGASVTPTITQTPPLTSIHYAPPALFPPGSSHTVSLTYADQIAPTPNTNTLQWGFVAGTYATLPTNLLANPSLVSANPGFALRISQIGAHLGQSVARAENQLANLLIDPNTGLPYANYATIQATNEPGVINYSGAQVLGNFQTEQPNSFPGLPGALPDTTPTGDTNAALEAVTYLFLNANALYTLGVNSSDGFRLTLASTPDTFAQQQALADGVRAPANTFSTFGVALSGYYPFRICYFVGGMEPVNPTGDTPSLEFFSMDAAGNQVLINDTNTLGFIPALLPAQTLPYIRSVSPTAGSTGVPHSTGIDVTLVDGSLTVQTNSIQLQLNGAVVTPIISSNAGITSVHYQPAAAFTPNSSNFVQIAFTDSAANRRTNTWNFIVENILSQLWVIPPNSSTNATWAKWVTTGNTERGLAYNPKTGHALLVSRSTVSGGPGANGGIAILDGNTGIILGTMDVSLSAASGVGTFRLNMIDVADDGVIYACNLSTSAAQNFQIYRWQNETAPQTLVYNAAPTASAGTPRWGDDFVVRGSGAGTQIIASGNNGSANSVPLFTTFDGTDFNLTLYAPTGLPNGSVRLGIAFGCGNTFYGETSGGGNPVRYVSFNAPPATASALITNYTIVDYGGNATIGPIGVDIPNQRLIGDATSQVTGSSHSMNLYDLNTLATSGNNPPLDHKTFATSTGSFGTGAVDFSPDGTRVYTLDTGNGIIAFSLSPKLAAPTICAQPQKFMIWPTNSIGFMDVMAIGAPQSFQWRFNGTNILAGATNRTLDIYNVQQANLGWYNVVVSNALGRATSSLALLDIQMVITNPPTDQVVTQGNPVSFSAGVAGGAQPLGFQWRLNGVSISGATSSTYTIPNADYSNAAYAGYSVLVTDALTQAVATASVTLNVEPATPPAPGTGTGLFGMYFTNVNYGVATTPPNPFTGAPALTRVDPTVNFDFGTGSFDPGTYPNATDYFQVRWVGQLQPLYSQTYKFFTTSDDGQRLWVNGTKLIDDWALHGPTERNGNIALAAGQLYPITYEFFEKTGGAVAKLWWWSPSQVKAAVPMEQLYPGSGPLLTSFTTSISNGTNLVLNWVGTCVLQTAPVVTGPWTPLTTNAGPYTVNLNASPQQYYRLLSQEF